MIKQIFTFFAFSYFLLSFLGAYELHITEVLVDGSDEFIEIANKGDSVFSGSLSISGVKASLVTIPTLSLESGEILILGDNLSYLSSSFTGQKRSGLGLSLLDTAPLALSLIVSGETIDELFVSSGDVKSLDDTMTSFSRARDGSSFLLGPTPTHLARGSTILANPGRVYTSDDLVFLPKVILATTGVESGGDIDDYTTSSGAVCPDSGMLSIDEVYNASTYGHYIELLFQEDSEGGFILSGDALVNSIEIPSQMWEKNTRYLISNSLSGLLHESNIVLLPDLQIGTGILTLSRQDGQVMDRVILDHTGASRYDEKTTNCTRSFTQTLSPSPGFDEQFLLYMNTPAPTNICPITPLPQEPDDNETLPPSSTGTTISSGVLRISLIDYDPPGSDTNNERIGLLSLSGDRLLSGRTLKYDGKTYALGSGLVRYGQEYITTANFLLVNSRPVCVSLFFVSELVDTACYNPSLHPSPHLPLGHTQDTIDHNNIQLEILSVMYDPPGSDTDNESITIRLNSGADSIALDDLRLRVGTKTKRIYGTILSGQTMTFVGNFQMPNSSDTCVALTYGDIVYDEYCYTIPQKPIVPDKNSPQPTAYLTYDISIEQVLYDPPGSDRDKETITLRLSTPGSVDLSQLRLRFGTTTRSLKGVLSYGNSVTFTGDYQLPNSKATCLDLLYGEHIFDTYCYDPLSDTPLSGEQLSDIFSGRDLKIDHILYDPPGSDTNNEVITLTVSETLQLQQPLYLLFHNTKKKLSDILELSGTMTFVGNYQLPNSKATCVKLLSVSQVLDEYCYDPQAKHIVLSGVVESSVWSGLELSRVLPNPHGKDITKNNELLALSWKGDPTLRATDDLKIKIGTSSFSLSGQIFSSSETLIASSKTLPNTPQCIFLYEGDQVLDRICYPQASEGTRYYHPRLQKGPSTIPDSLVAALDFQQGNLSKLILKKIEKKICLTYEGVKIRCLSSGESSTSKKNRALLTLNNSYIARITNLFYTNQLHPQTLRQRFQSYHILSGRIKDNNLGVLTIYGADLKPTELQRHVDLVANQSADDYLLDQFGRSLFGHDTMDRYYKKIYRQ